MDLGAEAGVGVEGCWDRWPLQDRRFEDRAGRRWRACYQARCRFRLRRPRSRSRTRIRTPLFPAARAQRRDNDRGDKPIFTSPDRRRRRVVLAPQPGVPVPSHVGRFLVAAFAGRAADVGGEVAVGEGVAEGGDGEEAGARGVVEGGAGGGG